MKNVDCVIVTYNRLDLLKECIKSVLEQTYPINKIFVIDNNSKDETWPYLQQIKYKYSNIIPIHVKKNVGGAGGFNIGIKEFIKSSNSDFVWLMDDDTIPSKYALENLMKHHNEKNIGFLSSNVRWKDGNPASMNIPSPTEDWNIHANNGLIKIKSASFVSILFPRTTINKVGYPIKDFFIWGDDMEFTLRITQAYKLDGYMVNDSLVEHKIKSNIGTNIIEEKDINRISRYYYDRRNTIFYLKKYEGKKQLVKTFIKQLVIDPTKIMFKSPNHKSKRLATSLKGTMAGIFFKPNIEKIEKDKNIKN